jgi:beta-galactosidase
MAKRLIVLVCSFLLAGSTAAKPYRPLSSPRTRYNFNSDWKVAVGDTDKAAGSYDDNEVTDWSKDGQLATAWIKYELAQPANIDELTLKMGGWRTRSYPLRISVDDKVVWSGQTRQSLGYVTISFPALTGQSVRIELTASPREFDAFGNIVELADPKNGTIGAANSGRGTLNLVEVEIYEPVAGKRR